MRIFDTQAALAKIRNQEGTPANPAKQGPRLARLALLAAPQPENRVFEDALHAAEERGSIIEFEGGLSRAEAEALALKQHGPNILAALNRGDLSNDNLTFALLRQLHGEGRND